MYRYERRAAKPTRPKNTDGLKNWLESLDKEWLSLSRSLKEVMAAIKKREADAATNEEGAFWRRLEEELTNFEALHRNDPIQACLDKLR